MIDDAASASNTLSPSTEPVRQFSLFLENRVGALLAVVRLLKAHQIEVIGHSLQEITELTLARLIVTDPEGAATLFMERGIAHTRTVVVVTELRDESHDLGRCLEVLQEAEINLRTCYPLSIRPGLYPLVAMHVDETDTAVYALNNSGFTVLQARDLVR
jgi:hypothetical protein